MDYDLCVIGGGINGAGIARDAAGRGLSVLLVEAKDLACATSSASTKLIHGGLRYLEYGEFKMVREALQERERLLRAAPHVIWPLDFVLPHVPEQRPFWMIRLGLYLYDFLGGRQLLKASRTVRFKDSQLGAPLKDEYKRGFVYSDCWADDSRLVVLNAMDARSHGAQIMTQTRCTGLKALDDGWCVSLVSGGDNDTFDVTAKAVVNAAGPWVRDVLDASKLETPETPKVRLVKGSHIIVPRLFYGDHCYILQQSDRRIVFAIPYEGQYTLIGTTEEAFEGDSYDAQISDGEIDYLCAAASYYFEKPVERSSVEWSYAGVRPLFDDGSDNVTNASRDYQIYTQGEADHPLLSVFGGKLTTYRVVAEDVVNKLMRLTGRSGKAWTADASLPGGDIPAADYGAFLEKSLARYGFLDDDLVQRYARAYGTKLHDILQDVSCIDGLGAYYGDGVYEVELRYLVDQEWALCAEDVLWRRSKLGLHVSADTVAAVTDAVDAIVAEGA